MKITRLGLIFCFCCLLSNVSAQQCDNSRPLSTPDDNFFINDNGTVTDVESGLTWMRCAVGQKWQGNTCAGAAITYSWPQAFKVEDTINQTQAYAGLHNWRLPTLSELASIVERQCSYPRINLKLFPATPAAAFWTANHKKGGEPQAFAMDFGKQGMQVTPQQAKLYLRLVSGRR